MVDNLKKTDWPGGAPPSEFMQLASENRLTIPTPILRAIGWKDARMKLVAELMEPKRVRLHRREDIEPKLESLRELLATADTTNEEESLEKLSILGDRYRPISMENSGRFIITDAILLHLGIVPGDHPFLFVRVFGNSIEILTQDEREKRKERYRPDTTP